MATFSTHGMCDGTAADSEAAAEAAPRWQDGNSKANLGSGSKGSHRTSTTDSVVFAIIVQGPTNSCCRAADIPRQPPRLFCGAPLRPPQRRATPAFTTISGYDGRMQAGSQKPAQAGLQESCGEKAEIYHQ